ncbi:MAG TPA: type IV secretion system protein VirB4 [Acetobacteraceae bacterium]|nr:type IV secretion system protein VirB4 [Acetobacteraceae bacterium]
MAARDRSNMIARNIADPRLELWVHFTRIDRQRAMTLPPCRSWWARRFDDAYQQRCLGDGLFRNDLFVTLLMHPDSTLTGAFRGVVRSRWQATPSAEAQFVQDFEDVVARLSAGLARYGVRRLGLREKSGVWFSEIAEAYHQILNRYFRPVPLVAGRLGRLVCPDRPVFGVRAWELIGEAGPQFGTILSFLEYPARTHPLMFEPFVRAPFSCTATDSFSFTQKTKALGRLNFRGKQMLSADDPAVSQIAELKRAEDDLQSNRYVWGSHHHSLAVHGRTLEEVDRNAAKAQAMLADAGAAVVREDRALKAAFFAQLPGNARWRVRPGGIHSRNFASLAALNNIPTGSRRGRWGAPLITFRTTADTEYAFHFHVTDAPSIPAEDLGNLVVTGLAGSGKTSLLGTTLVCAERQGARVVFIDKDYGLAAMCRAVGGVYLVLPAGRPSGLAPLRGLTDTPEHRAFLEEFVRNLILADAGAALTPDEDARLKRAIALQMRMPVELRSLEGVADMLGQRDRMGAGARLRTWCRGGRLGWAFDNDEDQLRFDARMIGFDTTALLKNQTVCAPTLTYLFYRVRALIDGTPFALAIDEFWQAFAVPSFVAMAEDQIRTIRKNEGVVLMATQSAHDLVVSPIAHMFKQNVPTKIFFGDEGASPEDLTALDCTPEEIRAVKQVLPLMRFSFLIKRPSGSVICRFDLSAAREKVAVISGRRATYSLMLRLIEQYGDRPEDWVPHYECDAPHLAEDPTGIQQTPETEMAFA